MSEWQTCSIGLRSPFASVTSVPPTRHLPGRGGRKIIPRFGERACLLFGIALGVLAFCAYGLATEGWMIYAIIAVASLGGVAGPAAQSITSKAVGPSEQGLLQGALGSLGSVAGIAGPLVATRAFHTFTAGKPPYPFPGASAPFFSGAALVLLALAPIGLVWSRMPRRVADRTASSPASEPEAGSAERGPTVG